MAEQIHYETTAKLIVAHLIAQLRLALALLEDLGGGIILYLTRRPLHSLANKMRTYQLQHDGIDTFDANTTFGFDKARAITASRTHASDAELHLDRAAHQQSGQALRFHKDRH